MFGRRAHRLLCRAQPVSGHKSGVDSEDVIADFIIFPGLHQLHSIPQHLAAHLWILNQDAAFPQTV